MDGWAYLCETADQVNSTLAENSTLSSDRLCSLSGLKAAKTPIAAKHSSFLSGGCATKKKNQFPLPCLGVRVTATQASTSEDLKAALSHFPAQTQLAKHSFTLTANISSPFIWHLTVFSQSLGRICSSTPLWDPLLAGALTPHSVFCFLCLEVKQSDRIVRGKISLVQ